MGPVMDRSASPAGQEPTDKLAASGQLSENLDAHKSSLLSHLQLVESLDSGKGAPISQILESAQKLVDQFATLREQLASIGIGAASVTTKDSAGSQNLREKLKARMPLPTTKTNGKRTARNIEESESGMATSSEGGGAGRKRSRRESDYSEEAQASPQSLSASRKRARTKSEISGSHDAVEDFVPVALQKDDISEEVERRLKLKEERRKKSSTEQPERKRKRDSTSSRNGSRNGSSSWSAKHRMKRSQDSNNDAGED